MEIPEVSYEHLLILCEKPEFINALVQLTEEVVACCQAPEKHCGGKFQHPKNTLIVGPTQCGKSTLVENILREKSISPWPIVRYVFTDKQSDTFENWKREDLITDYFIGLDKDRLNRLTENSNTDQPQLIIIDDLMSEASKSDILPNLFSRGSHHSNTSVIFITQDLYSGPKLKTCKQNTHYLVYFNNPANDQLSLFTSKADKKYRQHIKDIYEKYVERRPYGYMIIDLNQDNCGTIYRGIPFQHCHLPK